MAQTTRTRPRVCLVGVSLILFPILGVKFPKKTFLGSWIGFIKPNSTGEILRVLYYRNYCIDSNQILHDDKDHQGVIASGPNTRPANPRWRMAAILQNPLNRHVPCRQPFDRFGWNLAQWRSLALFNGPTVKISNFWKSKMAAAILKITGITISPQWFDRSLRNLVVWCKMGFLTASTVKKLNFRNPRWRTAAILKTVKSPYLGNRLTDLDEIWHSEA